jgi:hypothetical protein
MRDARDEVILAQLDMLAEMREELAYVRQELEQERDRNELLKKKCNALAILLEVTDE